MLFSVFFCWCGNTKFVKTNQNHVEMSFFLIAEIIKICCFFQNKKISSEIQKCLDKSHWSKSGIYVFPNMHAETEIVIEIHFCSSWVKFEGSKFLAKNSNPLRVVTITVLELDRKLDFFHQHMQFLRSRCQSVENLQQNCGTTFLS